MDETTSAPSHGVGYPAGAIHNGRESLRRLVAHHDFESAGMPIAMCSDYDEAVRCFEFIVSALAMAGATQELRVVFDGPPGLNGGRFVEVEDASGHSVRAGEWHARPDGYHELRIAAPTPPTTLTEAVAAARAETERYEMALKLAMRLVQRCVGEGIAFEEDDPLPELESWKVAEAIAETLGIDMNSAAYVDLFKGPLTPGGRTDG